MSSDVYSAARRSINARQAETVEKLLAAGLEELRSVGPDGLTIRSVAVRAGVSAATAYTYLASKNHLFAELFWRYLDADRDFRPVGRTATERVQSVTRRMGERLEAAPELAAAVTSALLASDPDVEQLRLRIGGAFVDQFAAALGEDGDADLLEALALALSGALLQAGMGLMTYTEMGGRLDTVVATIVRGNA